jgi:hypothetical protein
MCINEQAMEIPRTVTSYFNKFVEEKNLLADCPGKELYYPADPEPQGGS